MPDCNKIIKLYADFKMRPIDTAEEVNPINEFTIKVVGDKVKEWARDKVTKNPLVKGAEYAAKKVLTKESALFVGKIVGSTFSVVTGLLETNDHMHSGVEEFYEVLKSIIVDIDQSTPDYYGALKKIDRLREALNIIKIEERGVLVNCANCFSALEGIINDIQALCNSKGVTDHAIMTSAK